MCCPEVDDDDIKIKALGSGLNIKNDMSFDYTREDLFNPCLKAVRKLGGSAKKSEIAHTVIDIMSLSDDEVDDVHRGTATKLQYQLSWSLHSFLSLFSQF